MHSSKKLLNLDGSLTFPGLHVYGVLWCIYVLIQGLFENESALVEAMACRLNEDKPVARPITQSTDTSMRQPASTN